MIDNDSIQVPKDESQEAFSRYLPKRIAAVEQRMQRHRSEGWDHNGMTVLKGDLLRLGDASSRHGMPEICRHMLILARMVGEHVANNSVPDPQQALRMFAELSKVSELVPVTIDYPDHAETSATAQETNKQLSPSEWQIDGLETLPVAGASVVAAAAAFEVVEPVAPIAQPESFEWELVEPSAHVEPIDAATPIEPAETIAHPLTELSSDVEVAETSAPIEQMTPIEPIQSIEPVQLLELEPAEPIAHVDPVETAISPMQVEAAAAPMPEVPAPMATPVEPFEAVDTVDLSELDEPDTASEGGVRRVFHLNDGKAFAIELGKRLESEGYSVEPVESVDELSELLMCLMPQMLLVDASHMSDLDAIDRIRSETQQRSQTQRRIQMVALAAQDNMEARRAAHRAGVDVLMFPPFDIADVVGRLRDLDTVTEEQQVCVLIVDDERADALFAQTVLTRAGMQAHVENDPTKVLESIKALHPDLVLMDLHMPFANGVEVTMLIRQDPVSARLPIVFLSGESDPDSRLEAINAGGDDFLFKPIRPKNLIAAVRERMRHMHPISKQSPAVGASDDPTGMQRRA